MKNGIILITIFVIAFIGFSCKSRAGKHINEGEIHYNIEYGDNLSGVPREILPKNLVAHFKENKILFEILSVFGNLGITFLSNPKDEIYDTYFNFFTIKYYYEASKFELFPGFDAMEGIEIKKTNRTMVISEFNCKHAEVTLPFDRNKIIDIWYTDEIDIKDPNNATPFEEIDGVLLDFFFYIGETKIHFKVENVYSKTINDKVFARRSNYQKATKEEINSLIYKTVSF